MNIQSFVDDLSLKTPIYFTSKDIDEHPECDVLFIDLHSVMKHSIRTLHDFEEQPEEKLINKIIDDIEEIITVLKPMKMCVLFAGGAQPFINSDANRVHLRETLRQGNNGHILTRKNAEAYIQPGTMFMERLHQNITYFIENQLKNENQGLMFHYSSYHNPGEAFYKMVKFINEEMKGFGTDSKDIWMFYSSNMKASMLFFIDIMKRYDNSIYYFQSFHPLSMVFIRIHEMKKILIAEYLQGDESNLEIFFDDLLLLLLMFDERVNLNFDLVCKKYIEFADGKRFLMQKGKFDIKNMSDFLQFFPDYTTNETMDITKQNCFQVYEYFLWSFNYYKADCKNWFFVYDAKILISINTLSKFMTYYDNEFIHSDKTIPTTFENLLISLPQTYHFLLPVCLQNLELKSYTFIHNFVVEKMRQLTKEERYRTRPQSIYVFNDKSENVKYEVDYDMVNERTKTRTSRTKDEIITNAPPFIDTKPNEDEGTEIKAIDTLNRNELINPSDFQPEDKEDSFNESVRTDPVDDPITSVDEFRIEDEKSSAIGEPKLDNTNECNRSQEISTDLPYEPPVPSHTDIVTPRKSTILSPFQRLKSRLMEEALARKRAREPVENTSDNEPKIGTLSESLSGKLNHDNEFIIDELSYVIPLDRQSSRRFSPKSSRDRGSVDFSNIPQLKDGYFSGQGKNQGLTDSVSALKDTTSSSQFAANGSLPKPDFSQHDGKTPSDTLLSNSPKSPIDTKSPRSNSRKSDFALYADTHRYANVTDKSIKHSRRSKSTRSKHHHTKDQDIYFLRRERDLDQREAEYLYDLKAFNETYYDVQKARDQIENWNDRSASVRDALNLIERRLTDYVDDLLRRKKNAEQTLKAPFPNTTKEDFELAKVKTDIENLKELKKKLNSPEVLEALKDVQNIKQVTAYNQTKGQILDQKKTNYCKDKLRVERLGKFYQTLESISEQLDKGLVTNLTPEEQSKRKELIHTEKGLLLKRQNDIYKRERDIIQRENEMELQKKLIKEELFNLREKFKSLQNERDYLTIKQQELEEKVAYAERDMALELESLTQKLDVQNNNKRMISEYENDLKKRLAHIEELKRKIKRLKESVGEKQKKIEVQQVVVAEINKECEEIKKKLEEKNARVDELDRLVKEILEKCSDLQAYIEMNAQYDENLAAQRELIELEKILKQNQAENPDI